MDLAQKVAIVTGAGSGLGAATCRILAAAGAHVCGLDRDASRLVAIEASGLRVSGLAVDVSVPEEVEQAVASVAAQHGAVHVVVNCAGVLRAAKTVSRKGGFPLVAWNEVIAVNLAGTFHVIRAAALVMKDNRPDPETGERGVIVNVSSGAAWQGQIGQAAYSASKAGVIGLTLPVARDLAEHAIRVVTVAPGLFDTDMVADMPTHVGEAILQRMVLYPKRRGRPEEFARLVRHIVENEYLNATTIALDAGARLTAQ